MENFAVTIAETARAMRRDFDRRAAGLGVTRAQWQVLVRLSRKDGIRQVDLAESLDVEPITLCRMIDRLEQAGLVERRRDEEDRRAWNIHLTPKAEPVKRELARLGEGFLADALAGVSEAEQQAVLTVLSQIRANLNGSGTASARRAS